jgi:colanic acid biosynthesis glycosyl transferase WcaI
MRIQLWSYNYDPEPQGIAPLSATLARGLADRGHELLVVAAHPHYPEPVWGRRLRPYRERRDGISVLRAPLWPGRNTGLARIRQELSFLASLSMIAPWLPAADAMIAVTPSFPALATAAAVARGRGIPWVMWVQDIVTDGASTTGQLGEGRLLRAARRFERATYAEADRVVVISETFRDNLLAKGVRPDKIDRIVNPLTRVASQPNDLDALAQAPPRILAMGNIGHTQGLDGIVTAFEASDALAGLGARLVIAGSGVAAEATRAAISTDRVLMPGVLYGDELTPALRTASLGLISQRADIAEFNLPSKLMNYMAYGIPVLASVNPSSETARLVRESGGGWVTDASRPAAFADAAARLLTDRGALREAGRAGYAYASTHFLPDAVAAQFERVLLGVTGTPRSEAQRVKPVAREQEVAL